MPSDVKVAFITGGGQLFVREMICSATDVYSVGHGPGRD